MFNRLWPFLLSIVGWINLSWAYTFHVACSAERLLVAKRYFCLPDGSIHCTSGWAHDPMVGPDHTNPCPMPLCPHGCEHGKCTAPNQCACDVGWRGMNCNLCIDFPGCLHGSCRNESMKCYCDDGWTGTKCDQPVCTMCDHGHCARPGVCLCQDGWTGSGCDQCIPSIGCANGGVCQDNVTNTCQCVGPWTGHLCEDPLCTPPCHPMNGVCQTVVTIEGERVPRCLCRSGYQGPTCAMCKPYWNCPNKDPLTACELPNQCLCPQNLSKLRFFDPHGLCNNPHLTSFHQTQQNLHHIFSQRIQ